MKGVLVAVLVACSFSAVAANFDDKAGAFTDAARDRKIPYRIYYPKPLDGQYPVVIFSHGLGGSRDGNEQFGKHLAGRGIIVVHVQHAGSDEGLIEGVRDARMAQVKLAQSLRQPVNAQNRFLDVAFVVTQLSILNETDKLLKGHLNLQALGMAGHSYGAVSTMVAAGELIGARNLSLKVPTVRAGILLSPSPPRDGADIARAYKDVSIPLFHMTGTHDVALVDARDVTAKDRLIPFQSLSIPKQYLLVLDQAEHMTFSGRRIGTREEAKLDKEHMIAVLNGALAFFRAYLLDDLDAEKWLQTEYKKTLDGKDVFEFK